MSALKSPGRSSALSDVAEGLGGGILGDVTDEAQAAFLPADEEWSSADSTASLKLAERSMPQWSFRRASLGILMGRQ